MRTTNRLYVAIFIILSLALSGSAQTSDSTKSTFKKSNHLVKTVPNSSLTFKLLNNYMIVLPVTINGQGPFDFLFDSATTTTVIDPEVARLLTLPSLNNNTPLITIAGNRDLPWTKLNTFNIGNIELNNLPAIIANITEIQNASRTIKGIIGANASTQFNYLIEYDAQLFQIESVDEIGAQLSGTLIRTTRDSGRNIITLKNADTQQDSLLVLDSAIPEIILFNKATNTLNLKLKRASAHNIGTTNGNTSAQEVIIQELKFSNDTLITKRSAYLLPSSASITNRPEHGLLPTRLFHSIYVNNHENVVILNPKH